MFNGFLIKFESQFNFEQTREVCDLLEKLTHEYIYIPHTSFVRYKGCYGEYVVRIDFQKLDDVNCITVSLIN